MRDMGVTFYNCGTWAQNVYFELEILYRDFFLFIKILGNSNDNYDDLVFYAPFNII